MNLGTDLDGQYSGWYGQQDEFSEPLMRSRYSQSASLDGGTIEAFQVNQMAYQSVNPLVTEVVYGDLRYGDDLNPTRYYTYKDDFRIVADRDMQFRFNLNSNYFDTLLQIVDRPTGQVVFWNDNANYSYNSEINLTVRAGTDFFVRVTSAQAYATGAYSLSGTVNYLAPAPTPTPTPIPTPTPTPTPGNPAFSSVYGYGLVDAGAAVARALGRSQPLPEVRDLGGNNWGNRVVG